VTGLEDSGLGGREGETVGPWVAGGVRDGEGNHVHVWGVG